MRIKICGITNLKDALLAQQLGADAVGFIFYNESKRYILPEAAAEIIGNLSPFILKTGVFVNSSPDEINKIASVTKINLVQLHGDEKPEIINQINLPAVKAFRVNGTFNFDLVETYMCSGFLFDSFSEEEYGGTGKTFNWNIIPPRLKNKIILAGGISIRNLEAVIKINPAAIDVSSSLETYPGKKDEKKMQEFFKEFNKYRRSLC